jgi:hypothetical protein
VSPLAGTTPPAYHAWVSPPEFSICTLVTRPAEYAAMRASFAAGGFDETCCEYLDIDNSAGNRLDAYAGLRAMIAAAQGETLILCHQDVRLIADGAAVLRARLAALPADWAVAGNAGVTAEGRYAIRISDPHGEDQHRGPLPARVVSLDENFLVLKRAAGLLPSAALRGFHLYGTDLCLHARLAGRSAWVLDFHLRHLSPGRVDAGFLAEQKEFEHHWGAILGRTERLRTLATRLTLAAGPLGRALAAWRRRRRG